MASFLPSFFQKRLLRYALSRLELVDTEALDLDSLGIRWGQRSTVELRDIGLRLEKLASFLHLPPSSELLSARVRFLKITVPADIYSSGIVCEASGIEIHLRISSEEIGPLDDGRKPSTSAQDATDDQILPTPTDLAQSFLEAEPKEEKDELQAAISSRSQVLQHRSSASLSDDEEELGLGNESLSLPSFVAGFLKGIADRLQVRVNDIAIRIDMVLKQDGPAKRQPEEEPDLVTAVLSVREVKVDGVSTTSSDDASHARTVGKRLVSISDINMDLVSDPLVFSNYSRFAAPPSPNDMTQSKSSQLPSRALSPPLSESSGNSNLAMTRSTIFGIPNEPQEKEPGQPETPRPTAPQMEASAYTFYGQFSDADSEGDTRSDRYLQDSQNLADDGILDNPDYLDSVIDTQYDDDDIEGASRPWPRGEQRPVDSEITSRPLSPRLHFSESMPQSDVGQSRISAGISAIPERPPSTHGSVNDSQVGLGITESAVHRTGFSELPHLLDSSLNERHAKEQEQPPSHTWSAPSEAGSAHSHSGSSNGDLSESKFFSHEEAQSMYMSAISQESGSGSFMPAMPGAWDSESTVLRPNPAQETASHHEEQEESVSTPKLSGQSGLFAHAREQGTGDNSEAQSEMTEKDLGQSTSELNKVTGVAKRFFGVDKVLIWIPPVEQSNEGGEGAPAESRRGSHEELEESTADLQESRIEDDLLSSRVYESTRLRPGTSHRSKESCADVHDEHKTVAVEVFSVDLQFDIATGWLLTKMSQRIAQAFGNSEEQPQPQPLKKSRQQEKPQAQGRQAINISLNKLSIKFVEHLHGHAYPAGGTGLHSSQSFSSCVEDIVLQAAASGLKARFATKKETMSLHLDISKFTLGFASGNLISFDESLKMRESTRDIMAPTHGDISLSLSKSPDSGRVNLTTLPLLVNFNIQRLEEVFGFLGGLSTILELGSSISSVSTVKGAKQEAPPPKRPRGVHFETAPPPASVEPDDSTPWKVNARVGGVVLDVVGETHCLKLGSTALKMVSRSEGIGVQVDKAKVSGPFLVEGSQDIPAKVSLTNIRVEYLFTPKEVDLDRLLALITPSKDKYDEDDDIMLDTLFRQRRQGSVLRVTVAGMKTVVSQINDLEPIFQLGNELGRFSSMAKYLPEDDRPGLLILALIREAESQVHIGGQVGDISAHLRNAEAAYISMPSLIAAQIGTMAVVRNGEEELLGEALILSREKSQDHTPLPVLMARFIADEMEPAVKIKLHNLRAEYTIPSVMAFLGFSEGMTRGDVASNMANSLVNLAEVQESRHASEKSSEEPGSPKEPVKPTRLALDLRDCVIGLNPRNTPARGLVVLTNAKFSGTIHDPESSEAIFDLRKASIMVIDDVQNVGYTDNVSRARSTVPQSSQVQSLIDLGYVPVSSISSATATVNLLTSGDGTKSIDVELRDDLLILETCADSTQTLISIANGLQPPIPQTEAVKYRTEVMPIQDMLASFSGDAFDTDSVTARPEGVHDPVPIGEDDRREEIEDELEYVSDFYPTKPGSDTDEFAGMTGASDSEDLLDSFHSQYEVSSSFSELDFQSDHFAKQSAVGGTAHRWDSTQNTYGLSNDSKLQRSPLRVRVRDAHVIWNLFDGYDWQRTRDTISKAVKDVEKKASERRARTGGIRASPGLEEEEESVIGDCLFNSIYIGIPANKDPRDIRGDINRNIDDLVSETGSYATTTTVTGATARQSQSPSIRGKKLRLSRSKYHKMTFELKGVCADLVVFPSDSEETQSSLDVRVNDLTIFDHVPTSTWKKFATYMHEAGEKESGTSMIHLEILTVKPVPELAASEIVLKATILPVRLHVDQDALDFLCRFFEFRDESAVSTPPAPGEVPFLQRAEVNSVPVKLDFKPKRVDYAGLRSGRTTEFMNFFVLDGADMVLRHVIIYGISGFDKLGQTLNDIWMPDVKSNQLPGVLAGLAPIRSLVNVGGGVKDLVVVPMREYQKDGRIVRSIQRGAISFAKTTSNELVKLGAKLAIGTQTVLQGAEDLLSAQNAAAQQPIPSTAAGVTDEDLLDEEEAKKISLYADQPVGVVQGLRGAFTGLERDLLLARDAIVAVPGEVVESGSAKAAARAMWKRAPTVVLRPAIGVSKAVGQTLLGAGNTLDPANRRRMEDKYKRH